MSNEGSATVPGEQNPKITNNSWDYKPQGTETFDLAQRGSASPDEQRARMRDAGYEDWEIEEELAARADAEETVRRNIREIAETGRLGFEPNRIDPNLPPALPELREGIETGTERSVRVSEEATWIETSTTAQTWGGTIQEPEYRKIRSFDAEIEGQKVQVYERPSHEGWTIVVEQASEDGRRLAYYKPDIADLDLAKAAAAAMAHEAATTPYVLGETMPRNNSAIIQSVENTQKGNMMAEKKGFDGVLVCIPKKLNQNKDSARPYTVADKVTGEIKKRVEITLPPHTHINGKDVSYYQFSVKDSALKEYKNDPNYYHIAFPKANRHGEPWNVNLSRDNGHWENPEAATREEKGAWVSDIDALKIEATDFKMAMDTLRDDRKTYAQAQSVEKTLGTKSPAAAKDAATRTAGIASRTAAKSVNTSAKSK